MPVLYHTTAGFVLTITRHMFGKRVRGQGYNFTERVRKILADAREEALSLQHEYVGTEHLLLGLIREADHVQREGVGVSILQNLGADTNEIRRLVLEIIPRGKNAPANSDLPYTSRSKRALELAMEEARNLNHN